MRDQDMNQDSKLFSEQSAERNSPNRRFEKLEGADVDDNRNEQKEYSAGREVMRQYPAGGQSNQNPAQSRQGIQPAGSRMAGGQTGSQNQGQEAEQGFPDPDLGGGSKENNVPGTVSLDTNPIDRPTKLDNERFQ